MPISASDAVKLKVGDAVVLGGDEGLYKKGSAFEITRITPIPGKDKTLITAKTAEGKLASFDSTKWELPEGAVSGDHEEAMPFDEEEGDLAEQFRDFAPATPLAAAFYEALVEFGGSDANPFFDSAMAAAGVPSGRKWTDQQVADMYAAFSEETGAEIPEDLVDIEPEEEPVPVKAEVVKAPAAPETQPKRRGRPPKGATVVEMPAPAPAPEKTPEKAPEKTAPVVTPAPAAVTDRISVAYGVAGAILTALAQVSPKDMKAVFAEASTIVGKVI